jgi:hypothetical protein
MRLLRFHTVDGRARARAADDALTVHMELERGAPFCFNLDCVLHVRLLDSQVEGGGNWVTLADGVCSAAADSAARCCAMPAARAAGR